MQTSIREAQKGEFFRDSGRFFGAENDVESPYVRANPESAINRHRFCISPEVKSSRLNSGIGYLRINIV